jgi:hypothetical protein
MNEASSGPNARAFDVLPPVLLEDDDDARFSSPCSRGDEVPGEERLAGAGRPDEERRLARRNAARHHGVRPVDARRRACRVAPARTLLDADPRSENRSLGGRRAACLEGREAETPRRRLHQARRAIARWETGPGRIDRDGPARKPGDDAIHAGVAAALGAHADTKLLSFARRGMPRVVTLARCSPDSGRRR